MCFIPVYVFCVPDMKPGMAQLVKLKTTKGERVNIIESIAPVWRKVGFLDEMGQKVEAEHKQNGRDFCCQEIFKLWLDSQKATWGNLIELLVDSERKQLAEQVKNALDL